MNKDKQTKEYMEKLGAVKLSDSSRKRIENNLLEYAKFHGVRVGEESRSIKQVPPRTSFINLILNPKNKSMTAAIIALALIAGGGTSYAAEGAVPGDFLYPVKVELNENVKSAFAVSNESEAKLQARLAEERLHEAENLAARGNLTAEASTDISSRLKVHYDDAKMRSDKAEANGDYQSSATVRASLEGSLRAYADILADLNTSVKGNNGASLITDIRTYADTTAESQATATADVSADVKVDVEATMKRADSVIARVKAEMLQTKSKISAEAYARIEVKLNEAIFAQAEAKASFRSEVYQEAYASTQTAIRLASEAESRLNSLLRLKVNVGVSTEGVIDNMIDVRTETRTETESETDAESTNSDNQNEDESAIDLDLDINADTEVIDIETETNLRSGLNL